MSDIPENEPISFVAGDLVQWTKSHSDYPASAGWALTYYLVKSGVQETIVAEASGDDFLLTITAEDSAAYAAGVYAYQAQVVKTDEAYTLYSGAIEVLPGFAAQTTGYDNRSHVKKTLDALEAIIEGKASKDQLSYAIAGRSISRMSPGELLDWRDAYTAEYNRELRRAGRKKPQGIQVTFK